MKRFASLAAAVVVVSISQGALAADLAVKAAPPPPPAPTWTGLYVGVHAGAAWQSSSDWTVTDANFIPGVMGLAPQTLTGNPGLGGVGGLQVGYNWQFAPAWVAGVEGDISWASLGDNRTLRAGGANNPLSANLALSMSANPQWLASARGKIGFIWWGNGLYYFTGGAAWANTEFNGHRANVTGSETIDISSTTTNSGWVIGGGGEWMPADHLLFRVEYLYYSFSDTFSGSGARFPASTGAPLPVTFTWSNYNVQVVRAGLSYKF